MKKKTNKELEAIKAARKQSREEEIKAHGKLINYRKVFKSTKAYNRKNYKSDINEWIFIKLNNKKKEKVDHLEQQEYTFFVQNL